MYSSSLQYLMYYRLYSYYDTRAYSLVPIHYSRIHVHTRAYPRTLANTRTYSRILAHTHAYPRIPTHTRAYSGILAHTRAYSRILAHTRRYPGPRSAVALSRHSGFSKHIMCVSYFKACVDFVLSNGP